VARTGYCGARAPWFHAERHHLRQITRRWRSRARLQWARASRMLRGRRLFAPITTTTPSRAEPQPTGGSRCTPHDPRVPVTTRQIPTQIAGASPLTCEPENANHRVSQSARLRERGEWGDGRRASRPFDGGVRPGWADAWPAWEVADGPATVNPAEEQLVTQIPYHKHASAVRAIFTTNQLEHGASDIAPRSKRLSRSPDPKVSAEERPHTPPDLDRCHGPITSTVTHPPRREGGTERNHTT